MLVAAIPLASTDRPWPQTVPLYAPLRPSLQKMSVSVDIVGLIERKVAMLCLAGRMRNGYSIRSGPAVPATWDRAQRGPQRAVVKGRLGNHPLAHESRRACTSKNNNCPSPWYESIQVWSSADKEEWPVARRPGSSAPAIDFSFFFEPRRASLVGSTNEAPPFRSHH